jgi:hypothetical protein
MSSEHQNLEGPTTVQPSSYESSSDLASALVNIVTLVARAPGGPEQLEALWRSTMGGRSPEPLTWVRLGTAAVAVMPGGMAVFFMHQGTAKAEVRIHRAPWAAKLAPLAVEHMLRKALAFVGLPFTEGE